MRNLNSKTVWPLIAVSALPVSNLFVFGPVNIYLSNAEQFNAGILAILLRLVVPAFCSLILLVMAGLILPERPQKVYISILFALGALLWLQGNLIVWDYGLLDGNAIDWNEGKWRGYLDMSVWLALLTICSVLYKRVARFAATASVVLICIMSVNVLAAGAKSPGKFTFYTPDIRDNRPDEMACRFSSEGNVIHIIADAMASDMFEDLVREAPGRYENTFDGFTFFRECTTEYSSTIMSTFSVISEKKYVNQKTVQEFFNEVSPEETVPGLLHENGYAVDVIANSNLVYTSFKNAEYPNTFIVYLPSKNEVRNIAYYITDLVLFRYLPHFAKKYIYNDQSWFLLDMVLGNNKFQPVYFREVYKDFIDNMTVGGDRPTYKLLYMWGAHEPHALDADCGCGGKVLKKSRLNVLNASRCTVGQLSDFLDKLKEEGVYDSSLIIIHGDHGAKIPIDKERVNYFENKEVFPQKKWYFSFIVGRSNPLLLVKPPHSSGPMVTSDALVSLADIPATISSLTGVNGGFKGESVFGVDPSLPRERRFLNHVWHPAPLEDPYLRELKEYIIDGSVYDMASWKKRIDHPRPDGVE